GTHAPRVPARRLLGGPPAGARVTLFPPLRPGRERGRLRAPGGGVRAPAGRGPRRHRHPLGGGDGGAPRRGCGRLPAAGAGPRRRGARRGRRGAVVGAPAPPLLPRPRPPPPAPPPGPGRGGPPGPRPRRPRPGR